MKKLTTRQIALNGVVAGLYAAITILTASFAYGNIQFRIADSLCVLVVLEPSLTVGLTLGCLISNIFSTVSALDIVIGTAGTLLGCLLAARVKRDWLVPVPVILANAVLVGAMLAYVLTPDALVQGFFINGGEVLLGEAVVLYLLGVPLLLFFRRSGLMEKLLHGCYDYIATIESVHYGWLFAAFVAVLFTVAFILVKRQSRRDRYLNNYDAE